MDWLSRFKRAISAFWVLPASAKALVLETWGESVHVMIVLRTPWWRRILDQSGTDKGQATVEEAEIGEMAALANRTMSFPLLRMSCLERSLTLQRILCRRGVFAPLVFGVRREDENRIAAHAWLNLPALPEDGQSEYFQRLHNPITLQTD